MTYVVTDNCIKCKYMDCVEVCPVDCFYEGENMLVIHPDECIDCGVCEPECPAEAIKPDTEPGLEDWLTLNTEYASKSPNITVKRDAPEDAEEFDGMPGKLEKYFSAAPGEGDSRYHAACPWHESAAKTASVLILHQHALPPAHGSSGRLTLIKSLSERGF